METSLEDCSFRIDENYLSTNSMYANDLILHANNWNLSSVGLHLNTCNNKALTAADVQVPFFLDVGGNMIAMVHRKDESQISREK